jgi:hypothetical protein
MPFKLGEASNPNGRPKGSRNKRTQEVLDPIQARGDKDPLDALSDIVTKNQEPAIVAQASNILAPDSRQYPGRGPSAPRRSPRLRVME